MSRPLLPAVILLAALFPSAPQANEPPPGCTLNAGPYERIVTLAPHLAELAFEAGVGDRLVGTVEWSDYPAQANALPRIGDAFRVDMERLLALKPDAVISWSSGNPAEAIEQIRAFCIPVFETEPRTLDDISVQLEQIGELGGNPEAGKKAAGKFQARKTALESAHRHKTPIRYFYQVAERPLFTVGGEHLISHGLGLCGGSNVFFDIGALAPQVSRESVLSQFPEAMLAPAADWDSAEVASPLAGWLEWPALPAVQNQALYLLPADSVSRATPRLLDAVEIACTLFDTLRDDLGHDRIND